MISMNCRPPRAIATARPATFPAAKARIRNSRNSNIGSATLLSMTPNATSSATPATSRLTTTGLVQPSECCPYGWMPSVMATRIAPSPRAKVTLPHQSIRPGCRSPLSRSLR